MADDEERAQLLELVTPPRLPQELCELWLGRFTTTTDELLGLLAQYRDQLLTSLTQWDAVWADKGRFSEYHFKLTDEIELTILKARSDVIEQSEGAPSLKVRLHRETGDNDLRSLGELSVLAMLNLWGCQQITDAGLAHVKGLTQLTSLNLSCCNQIMDDGLPHIKKLTQLTSLNLSCYNMITDDGLAHVKKLTQLTSLNLSCYNLITDDCLAHVKKLTQLTSLVLWGCNLITDTGLAHVKELTQLTSLNLNYCNLITSQGQLFAHLLTADVDAHAPTHADMKWKLPDGTTLLHVAAQKSRKNAVAALLGEGADVNVVDGRGRTPLQIAIEANATDVIRLLQEKGA